MSSDKPMTVIFSGDDGVVLEFPDENLSVSVPIARVGENLYRLEAVPFLIEGAGYRDVVEAEPVGEGKLRVSRVVERSGWRTFTFILPSWKIDGEWGQALLRRLEELGGYWERVMGGLLFVCIPPGLDLDPTEWAESLSLVENLG
jgi:Domain of unknown function (DUF4265)